MKSVGSQYGGCVLAGFLKRCGGARDAGAGDGARHQVRRRLSRLAMALAAPLLGHPPAHLRPAGQPGRAPRPARDAAARRRPAAEAVRPAGRGRDLAGDVRGREDRGPALRRPVGRGLRPTARRRGGRRLHRQARPHHRPVRGRHRARRSRAAAGGRGEIVARRAGLLRGGGGGRDGLDADLPSASPALRGRGAITLEATAPEAGLPEGKTPARPISNASRRRWRRSRPCPRATSRCRSASAR